MTIYTVDRHERIHVCSGDPIHTMQRIVHTTPGGPCQRPVTVPAAADTASVVIDCGRTLPHAQQCHACRPITVIRNLTHELVNCDTLDSSGSHR